MKQSTTRNRLNHQIKRVIELVFTLLILIKQNRIDDDNIINNE